jgi:hypothetical protein
MGRFLEELISIGVILLSMVGLLIAILLHLAVPVAAILLIIKLL